jgi:hypothetical protein
MKTQFKTFYIRPNGQSIICLHSHFKWENGLKFYQYSWINKLTGITYEDFLWEDVVDEFFSENFVLLEDYFVSLSSKS